MFFIVLSMFLGYQILEPKNLGYFGMGIGLVLALVIVGFELVSRRISIRGLSSTVFGLILGLIMAKIVSDVFVLLRLQETTVSALRLILTLIFCYLGMVIATRGRDEFNLVIPYVKFSRQERGENIIILDTSAIIDGRIADICKIKFIEGRLILPRFILKELQQVADSPDALKRQRGRRGLNILHMIQKDMHIDIKIHEEDFPNIPEVDAKLIKIAKVLDAPIFTTDFNLNKVAEIQGVRVLNVNDLANALKPIILPGESMEVKLIREGKEYNQAVGYLDDGTMVIVEDSRRLISHTVKAIVTSVLQTPAGRMIFTKLETNFHHK